MTINQINRQKTIEAYISTIASISGYFAEGVSPGSEVEEVKSSSLRKLEKELNDLAVEIIKQKNIFNLEKNELYLKSKLKKVADVLNNLIRSGVQIDSASVREVFYKKVFFIESDFSLNCNRLNELFNRDKDLIKQKFGFSGDIRLTSVVVLSEESHVKGRFVAELKFSNGRSGENAVYLIQKDRSLALDAYLNDAEPVVIFGQENPIEVGQSLFSILDPKQINLGHVSYLLFGDHGYVKPVVYDPDLKDLDYEYFKLKEAPENYPPKVAGFVKKDLFSGSRSQRKLSKIAERCGFTAAVAEFLTLSDLHKGNVFYEKGIPKIIDPEVVFDLETLSLQGRKDSLLLMGLNEAIFGPCYSNCKDKNKSTFLKIKREAIETGYNKGKKAVADNKDKILTWLGGALGLRARWIPEKCATQNLSFALDTAVSEEGFLSSINELYEERNFIDRLSGGNPWMTTRTNVRANLLKSLGQCIAHHDIPAFECVFGPDTATIHCNETEIGVIEFNLLEIINQRFDFFLETSD